MRPSLMANATNSVAFSLRWLSSSFSAFSARDWSSMMAAEIDLPSASLLFKPNAIYASAVRMILSISLLLGLLMFNNASTLSFTRSSGMISPCLVYRRSAFLLLGTLTRLTSHSSQSVTVTRSSPFGRVRSSTALMMIPGLHPFKKPFFAWRLHFAPKVSSSS